MTIGWSAAPSDCHLIAAFSLTPWGCLGVPALLGETDGLTVTGGQVGLAARAIVAPAANARPATAAITSFRICDPPYIRLSAKGPAVANTIADLCAVLHTPLFLTSGTH